MTLARKQLAAIEGTQYYHVFSTMYVAVTCVVLLLIPVKTMTCFFFCKTGIHDIPVNNHHRRWTENRIRILSSLFAIDICSFAVMHIYYHVVLFIDKSKADN
jgi:uncharacterized sodium:solute symporter family permease YidK